MISKSKIITVILIILFLLTASTNTGEVASNSIMMIGDLQEVVLNFSAEFDWNNLKLDDKTYKSINFKTLFEYCNCSEADYLVLFEVEDGMKIKIENSCGDLYIYSSDLG